MHYSQVLFWSCGKKKFSVKVGSVLCRIIVKVGCAVFVQPHVVHCIVCKAVDGTHLSGHQGHPTNKAGKNLFEDISRLLVMLYKYCLK